MLLLKCEIVDTKSLESMLPISAGVPRVSRIVVAGVYTFCLFIVEEMDVHVFVQNLNIIYDKS